MVENRIKKENIIAIKVYDRKLIHYIVYKEYKPTRFFGIIGEVKEGYYDTSNYGPDIISNLNDKFIYDDKKCYTKPHCDIVMTYEKITKIFQTLEEAKQYADHIETECGLNLVKVIL